MIEISSRWLHLETNKIYTVLAIANEHADREGWPVLVIYKEDNDGYIWACTVEKFLKGKTLSF